MKRLKTRALKKLRNPQRLRSRCKLFHDLMAKMRKKENKSCHTLIYEGELLRLFRYTLEYGKLGLETCGQFFGTDTSKGTPVVNYVLGPGPDAEHYPAFCRQDIPFLQKQGKRLIEDFGLNQVGEWHSHHHLGLPFPSGHDSRNMLRNLKGMKRYLLCIATCDDHSANAVPFMFNPGGFAKWEWEIIPGESPVRTRMEAL